MFLINPKKDMASFAVQAAKFMDTLMVTVWVVGIYVIPMVSFYGILKIAQLTFARVAARHLAIQLCVYS